MPPYGSENGFSLIEVIIAVSIFALLGVMGVSMLSSFSGAQTQIIAAEGFLASIQQFRATLNADLQNAVKRPVRDLYGSNSKAVFKGNPSNKSEVLMSFVRANHMGALISDEAPAIQRVEYIFKEHALLRRAYLLPDATTETPVIEKIVFENVKSVQTRFHVGDRWIADWGTLSEGAARFPFLVEISVDVEGRGKLTNVFSVGGGI